jgi:hypothetical protein
MVTTGPAPRHKTLGTGCPGGPMWARNCKHAGEGPRATLTYLLTTDTTYGILPKPGNVFTRSL